MIHLSKISMFELYNLKYVVCHFQISMVRIIGLIFYILIIKPKLSVALIGLLALIGIIANHNINNY